jgi:hypothetical protein
MAIAAAGHGRIDKIDDVGGESHRWVPFHEEFFLIEEADCFVIIPSRQAICRRPGKW